ncbi:hypothetical protein [Bradyrhizobium tropiciagri]|uniref:terminase small subunit-like protein n=1 Tax=Bradyrhizobium tropiciagri TaxID=312253 RepID=UPI003D9BB852
MTDEAPKPGRPTLYTAEIAATILGRLSEGQTLRAVCRDEALPAESTVRLWALEDREGFAAVQPSPGDWLPLHGR